MIELCAKNANHLPLAWAEYLAKSALLPCNMTHFAAQHQSYWYAKWTGLHGEMGGIEM